MGVIRPSNLRILPFGGQATSGTTHVLGANGGPFMTGGSNDRYVPDMSTSALVVTWEIINTDPSNNLFVRFGPDTGSFTAASSQTLDNYFTLKPGVSYNFPVFDKSQQINDELGGVNYSVLLVTSSSSTCDYTGVCTVFDISDDS